ncbi:MAG: inorganic phosphate transporter, partial [Acidobacteria bacterium]|nr:inorganic phosphate transporter [Acidobacteriota bacterium]
INLQRLSAAYMAFSHGRNDAQKPMGVLAMALALYYGGKVTVPLWVVLSCSGTAALGTAYGGWRIIQTLGMRLTALNPVQGFAAEFAGATVIQLASSAGIPVSTTHAITSSIVGVGSVQRRSAVRWSLAKEILLSWVLTLPATLLMGALLLTLLRGLGLA